MKPIVYIAGPYTTGDPCINTHFQMVEFNKFLDEGIITPYIPLLAHFMHTAYPRPYTDWIQYDLEMLKTCDACIRMNPDIPRLDYKVNKSPGADAEEQWFIEHRRPVFYNKGDLYDWVSGIEQNDKAITNRRTKQ